MAAISIKILGSLIEVQRIAQRIVLEPGTADPATTVEPPYEGLPPWASDDLRPLFHSQDRTLPPWILAMVDGGADRFPIGEPARAAREPAAAAPLSKARVEHRLRQGWGVVSKIWPASGVGAHRDLSLSLPISLGGDGDAEREESREMERWVLYMKMYVSFTVKIYRDL